MGRITRWNAYGREVTNTPDDWHETDVEVIDFGPAGWRIGIRRIGGTRWELRSGTVPEAVRWWFSGENKE